MSSALVAEGLADLGRVPERFADTRRLHVEDAERRRRPLLSRLLVEDVVVCVEPLV